MATYHEGYKDIKVKLVNWEGNNLAKRVYEFGRLSNDYNYKLVETYDENHEDCIKLIDKIIEGTTLPKFALMGTRMEFQIEGISRICLAQLTRDNAIFASQGGGVFPLTMDFNIPLSLYKEDDIMEKVKEAQSLLEEAYIMACEREIPALESRYIGLHCQTISLTAAYTFSDFVRSCYSRTSSNFCDECNLIYRLMYRELVTAASKFTDNNSKNLFNWIFAESKCINDRTYKRERLYNSDFTWDKNYTPALPAINDWRKSCWKKELERLFMKGEAWLTEKECLLIEEWMYREQVEGETLPTTYDSTQPDVAVNMIKTMPYYKEHRNAQ